MKITKKILAGTLALMNVFTVLSAEPVKNETPSSDSTSAKSEKPNDKSTKKKLAKVAAGTVATLCGAAALTGYIFRLREEKERLKFLYISHLVLAWYVLPGFKNCIKKGGRLQEYTQYLFNVLSDKEAADKNHVKQALERLCFLAGSGKVMPHCDDFGRNPEKLYGRNASMACIEWLCDCYYSNVDVYEKFFKKEYWPEDIPNNMISVYVNSCVRNRYGLKNFMKIKSPRNSEVYNLMAIMVCDERNYCFNTIYLKQANGKWNRCSFDGVKETLDDSSIEAKFVKLTTDANLIYTKDW